MTRYFKSIFLCCLIFFTSLSVYCQIDTSELYERAKFLIVPEQSLKLTGDWKRFLEEHVTVKKLSTNGFSKTVFLLLQWRVWKTDDIPDSLFKKNEVYYNCDYIIAVYGGLLFRLKGFLNNDFFSFISEFSETSDIGYLLKEKIFSSKSLVIFKNKISKNNIYVEDLDMGCLYQYYQAQNITYQKTKNISCLGSCVIKDRNRPYQTK